jgi:uncharacterized protein YndB with AHSA1/START domain
MSRRALTIEAQDDRHLFMTRAFDAPRALVFEAHIRPELVQRWLGNSRMDWARCEIDARPGGSFRYEWTRARDGWRMGVSGRFLEVVAPERLVHTELFDEDWTGGEAIITTTFVALGPRRTRLEMLAAYTSPAARDAVLKTPMADGMEEGYVLLDGVLAQ